MRKICLLLCVLLTLLGMAGLAAAAPFEVTGSSLDVNWSTGGGLVYYDDNAMDAPIDLAAGESYDFTFGRIYFPLAWGSGTGGLDVQFSTPEFLEPVQDDFNFNVKSVFWISSGNLVFGDPTSFDYTYSGSPGVMTLAFADLHGVQLGSWVDIKGTITNSVAPVPQPTAILMMGFGLMGIAVLGRNQFRSKLQD
jgi:hypothetical protein